jgi:hypothetical protein
VKGRIWKRELYGFYFLFFFIFILERIVFILEPITCKVPTQNRNGVLRMGQPVGQYFHFFPVGVMVLKVTDDDR